MKLIKKLAVWFMGAQNKWFKHGGERLISVGLAKKIQQRAYEHTLAKHEDSFSPTYLQMVPDLDDKNEQVFRAAVHYLGKIAENNKKYREQIVILMNNRIASSRLSDDRKQQLKAKVDYLQSL